MRIQDGTGSGFEGKVDANSRLHTQSVTETEAIHAIEIGDGYNINTGNISFTGNGTLLYIKNNENQEIIVEALAIGLGSGTLSDSAEIYVERNTTGGDLISDATPVDINGNRNFGSSKTLTADIYKGKSGGTTSGGTDLVLFYQTASSRLFGSINLVIPKGSSMAVRIVPNLSSGSMKAYCAAIIHLKDPASKD